MPVEFLTLAEHRIAYQRLDGDPLKPGIIFLGGFASDMSGTKASYLAERCSSQHISYTRFDYRGNGQSDGNFTDGTIGAWLDDTLAVFDQLTKGPQIVIGSSMGGWLGLILAQKRAQRVKALIGIAAAPDFTTELMLPQLTDEQRQALKRDGQISGGHAPITLKLIEESRQHLILNAPIAVTCPVHLLQGKQDSEVPWHYADHIAEKINHKVEITYIEDGDHRLSRDQDLALLWQTVVPFLG